MENGEPKIKSKFELEKEYHDISDAILELAHSLLIRQHTHREFTLKIETIENEHRDIERELREETITINDAILKAKVVLEKLEALAN